MLQVLPEILGDDVQLPRVLLGLLGLAGLRDGAGEELERGGLGPPAGHQVGGSPRLRVLRGLGLLPWHRAGPGRSPLRLPGPGPARCAGVRGSLVAGVVQAALQAAPRLRLLPGRLGGAAASGQLVPGWVQTVLSWSVASSIRALILTRRPHADILFSGI